MRFRRVRHLRPKGYLRRRLVLLAIAAILAAIAYIARRPAEPPPPESLAEGTYQVRRVVDGDTLLLANGARVRLIVADTPETVRPDSPVERWGPEAAQFTEDFVACGEVRLQMDRERVDRYGRFLAYVWVGDEMLNEELIRAGLARARTEYACAEAMKTRFRRAEQEARRAGKGIWSEPAASH